MSETKHTPGPWRSEMVYDGACTVAMMRCWHGPLSVNADPWLRNATTGRLKTASELACEAEANARLIAAAPDLLEACEKVLAHYGDPAQGELFGLRAAIAKATGRD